MANREIKVILTADEKGFIKGAGKAEQSTSLLTRALEKMGPAGKGIQSVIDKLGLSSITSAAGMLAIPAALGVGYAAAQKAVNGYVELGEKVRQYSILTGQSAEESSRQVQAFGELGVSEDVAASGMVKLSKAIETAPKKLAAVGIEVAKDSQGNVDLGKTLLNVAAAWQGTTDAAKRNEIALAAFGKGGASMIPILEANGAELARLEKQVQTVYTAEDLKRVRDYQIAQKENERAGTDLSNSIGGFLLPAWLGNTQAMNENIYVNEHLDEQLAKMNATHSQSRVAIRLASEALREEYKASLDAQKAADSLAISQQDAANAAKAEADAENALYDSIHKSIDAGFAYTQAQIDLAKAQDAVKQTSGRDAEANLRLREAYVKMADAAVNQAVAQAEANGTTLTAAEKADIFRATLEKLAAGLDKNSPLRKQLQAYIDELNSIPSSKNTTIGYTGPRQVGSGGSTRTAGGTKSFDLGGMVDAPLGAPVDATVHGGEMVLTPAQQAALGGGARGGGVRDVHIHIDRGAYIDGPAVDQLANIIASRLAYATGR